MTPAETIGRPPDILNRIRLQSFDSRSMSFVIESTAASAIAVSQSPIQRTCLASSPTKGPENEEDGDDASLTSSSLFDQLDTECQSWTKPAIAALAKFLNSTLHQR